MCIRTKSAIVILLPALLVAGCSGGGNSLDTPSPAVNNAQVEPDPLVQYQWHLKNTGQTTFSAAAGVSGIDLNVTPIYSSGLSGNGVKVMVVDSGVEILHEDLAQNVDHSMLHNFGADATDANDPTPANGTITDAHGTMVAGIVGAAAGSGLGGQGVAPRASLGAVRLVGCGDSCNSPVAELDAFGGAPFSNGADIFNGSFGKAPTSPMSVDPLTDYSAVMLQHLETLRGGKGAINLQAAGNEFDNNNGERDVCEKSIAAGVSCSNASFDPSRTFPQTIVVGAVNASGVRSSYSTAGSALLISGLGGEFGNATGPAILTTDLSGCSKGMVQRRSDPTAYRNAFENPDSDIGKALNRDCKYTSTMNGTSAATPTVAGVVALMLEANPNLTWRDVRTILMKTARRVDSSRVAKTLSLPSGQSYVAEPAWTRNAAGLWFDNWYGFGLVNASAAVAMARGYTGYLKGSMVTSTLGGPLENAMPVPLGSADGLTLPVPNSGSSIGTIESIQIVLSLGKANMGDMAIEVLSPSGTRSVLQQPFNVLKNDGADVDNFLLASNAFNGESAQGTWKIRLIDVNARAGTEPAQVQLAALRVFGH